MVYSELLKRLGIELKQINIAKSIAEATYSNIRNQIRTIAYELRPQRIDQRIIQALATRGGMLKLSDLSLILHLTEEVLLDRLKELAAGELLTIDDDIIRLI